MYFKPSEILNRCEDLGRDRLVLPVLFSSQPLVEMATSKGIAVWIYGTEDLRDLDHSAMRGIGGLIVDPPGEAVAHFANWRP